MTAWVKPCVTRVDVLSLQLHVQEIIKCELQTKSHMYK